MSLFNPNKMKTIHRRLRRRWACGGLCPQMPAVGSQVSQKPGGQGHGPVGPLGKRHGQLSLLCELTPRPTWWLLCTSRKTGAALTGRKPLLGPCCGPGRGLRWAHTASFRHRPRPDPAGSLPPPLHGSQHPGYSGFSPSGSRPGLFLRCHPGGSSRKGPAGPELSRWSPHSGPALPAPGLAAVRTVSGTE